MFSQKISPDSQNSSPNVPAGYNGMLVGSQLPDSYTKKPINKRNIILVVATLVVLILVLVALSLTDVISFGKFKTVIYDNGKSQRFSVKFYGHHETKNVSSSLPSSGGDTTHGLKELASKVSISDKEPIVLWIESTSSPTSLSANNNCAASGLPKVFDVRMESINENVAVCTLRNQGADIMYVAAFHKSDKAYVAVIMQDVDFQKLLSSPEAAKNGLDKIGLETYNDDIKVIISSIKVLD